MKELYTVKISKEPFPTLDECSKETEEILIIVENENSNVTLMIESLEPDNYLEPEYQEPTYIMYVVVDGETIDRLSVWYDFREEMEVKDMIDIMVGYFRSYCM